MVRSGHLWAIGYDDVGRAARVRDEIIKLGWEKHDLILRDVILVERHPDGSFTVAPEPFPGVANILGCTVVGFLSGLLMAAPLTGAVVGALLGGSGAAIAAAAGLDDGFVRDVEGPMKPGTSALFVLDDGGDMEAILAAIRGWGGTVLKTNVDLERARLIQSTLAAGSADSIGSDGR